MFKSIFLLLTSSLFIILNINSQNQLIDSLKLELKKESVDTNRINLQYEIIHELSNIGQFENALTEIEEMEKLSKKSNYEIGEFKAKYSRANIYTFSSKKQKAVDILIPLEKEINSKKGSKYNSLKASIYSALGNIYDGYSSYEKALKYHTKSLILAKELGIKQNVCASLSNIANTLQNTGETDKAIETQLEAIEIKKEVGTPFSLGLSYFNLASYYDTKKDYTQAVNNYNISKDYAIEANDKVGIGICDLSLGNSYVSIAGLQIDKNDEKEFSLTKTQLLDKALSYQKDAIKILTEVNSTFYLPNAYNGLATVLGNQKKYREAEKYYLKARELTKANNLPTFKTATEGLYFINKERGNYKQALKWHEEFLTLKDSISGLSNQQEIGKQQAEFSFIKEKEISELKHQSEIKILNVENENEKLISQNKQRKQQYIIWTAIIGILIIGSFLFIIFRRWKTTTKQKELIAIQKQEIEKEKKATEDSINYAKSIQKAAFPSMEEVNKIVPNNFILFNPKDIVSGDFYWTAQHQNKSFIALADCTGHGVPGAFMTLISLNILNQILAEEITKPSDILEELHQRLQKRLNNKSNASLKHGLDIALCMIEANKLTFTGVHIPIYHVRNGNLTEYKGQKFQLGSNASTLFQQHEILLQKEDLFYISSDGFPDQKGGTKGKKYYYPNFRKFLLNISNKNLPEQRKELQQEFLAWKGEKEQLDDVSVIGFKI